MCDVLRNPTIWPNFIFIHIQFTSGIGVILFQIYIVYVCMSSMVTVDVISVVKIDTLKFYVYFLPPFWWEYVGYVLKPH